MNNLDRIFTKEPVAFAGAYLDYLTNVLKPLIQEKSASLLRRYSTPGSAVQIFILLVTVAVQQLPAILQTILRQEPIHTISLFEPSVSQTVMPSLPQWVTTLALKKYLCVNCEFLGERTMQWLLYLLRAIHLILLEPLTTPNQSASRPQLSPPSMVAR